MTTNKQKPTPDLSTSEKQNAFLEEYKLYVKMLEHSTKRRMDTNALFISIHTAMVTVVSLFNKGDGLPLLAVAIAGIAFSWLWRELLINYNTINGLKWDVVYDMEQFLPYKPFYGEWYDKLSKHDTEVWREGNYHSEGNKKYKSISKLERDILPVVFILIYIAIGGYGLYFLISGGGNTANLAETVAKLQEAVSDLETTLAEITRSSLAN